MNWLSKKDLSPMERAKEIARRALNGEYDILLTCRDLANLKGRLSGACDRAMDTFIGVASEVDDLPLGDERKLWATDALKALDIKASTYREQVRAAVEEALEQLLISLSKQD